MRRPYIIFFCFVLFRLALDVTTTTVAPRDPLLLDVAIISGSGQEEQGSGQNYVDVIMNPHHIGKRMVDVDEKFEGEDLIPIKDESVLRLLFLKE